MSTENEKSEIAALAARVRALEDREEIAKLIWSFGFYLDTGRWEEITEAMYTEDAEDEHAEHTDWPMIAKGHEELKKFFRSGMPNFDGTQHLNGPSWIEVDGDTATARTYVFASHWMKAGPGTGPIRPADCILSLIYDDDLVRTEDGWRFSRRRLHALGPGSSLAVGHMPPMFMPAVGLNLYGVVRESDRKKDD